MKNQQRRVVVCGYGAVTPLGSASPSDDTLCQALKAGETCIRPLPFDPIPLKISARVASWMPETFTTNDYLDLIPFHRQISNPKLHRCDLSIRLGMAAAALAYNDAGMTKIGNTENIGIQGSTGLGGGRSHEDGYHSFLQKRCNRDLSFVVVNTMPNAIAGIASIGYGLKGPSCVTSAACASGNYAIYEAIAKIRAHMVDAMLVIGTESMASAFMTASFDAMKALSPTNDPRASKPFGADRNGFVMGEGAGAIILAGLDWAERNDLTILAEIMGVAANSGANDIVQPSAEGAAACMAKAMEDACVYSSQIDYINTHGTATPIGDKAESQAIWQEFVINTPYIQKPTLPLINSSKALLGHTLGAAGILELIVSIMSIRDNCVHPMGSYVTDNECLRPYSQKDTYDRFNATLPITLSAVKKTIHIAMSNSFGFGDHNATVIIGRPQ